MQFLEKGNKLNRAIDSCPTTRSLPSRANGLGLTSPERAVLLAYSKIWLYDSAGIAARRSVGIGSTDAFFPPAWRRPMPGTWRGIR